MTKKKQLGTKAQIRAEKIKERRIAMAIFLTVILLATAFSVYFGYTILNSSPSLNFIEPTLQFKPENPKPELEAAIVDQVSLTFPNQTFIETAASALTGAGYTVDYFSGKKVTVDFYRTLPTRGYRVAMLRVHSAGYVLSGAGSSELQLFTSEPYSDTRYVTEQLQDEVGGVMYPSTSDVYLGITPKFVQHCMKDKFEGTVIIMMGCDGLAGTQMANAFIEKGAKAYISWSSSVSASHTDQATAQLLQHLVTEGQTIRQAVKNTMKEVGPDPSSQSTLGYYPDKAGEQTVDNIKSKG
jgi:hypothetical protein